MESWVAFATALVVLITAVIGYLKSLKRDLKEIHVLVNSQMTEALTRINQLRGALEDAHVEVPNIVGRAANGELAHPGTP